jgi:cell division protease FtsH
MLVNFGPTLLLIAGFLFISRRAAAAAGGGLFGLGQSRAKRYAEDSSKVTFDDVAGIDEAENELIEIVDFLKNPAKYQRLGGTVPKGVLLVGAPGTGKTLLARAHCRAGGVPFFSLSASEFIEMIVGVGASRVRDLFKQARAAAPAIVFIDELDAIGRTRGSGVQLGGHDEREQTLNQILTEMDGFDSREGVSCSPPRTARTCSTRPDAARAIRSPCGRPAPRPRAGARDPRGARPGECRWQRTCARADRRRDAWSGRPELRNLVNEAALLARGETRARLARTTSRGAAEDHVGPARNLLLNPADRERTAYHEAGHALLALLLPGSDPVHRVSIVPRGWSLGATYQLPIDDRITYAQDYLQGRSRAPSVAGRRRSLFTA